MKKTNRLSKTICEDYIALLPDGQEDAEDQDVWFYEYKENPDDANEEPELIYIESDEEYEKLIAMARQSYGE